MENIDFLTEVLRSKNEYWVVAKKNEFNTVVRKGRDKDSIIMIIIPDNINRGVKLNDIKLVELKLLYNVNLINNIYLNGNYPPFQIYQTLHDVYKGFPIPKNQKDFLTKALNLKSDDLYEYKKLIKVSN